MGGESHQPIACFRPMLCVGSSTKGMVRNCNVMVGVGGSLSQGMVRNCNVMVGVGGSLSHPHGSKMRGWMSEEPPLSPRIGCMGQIKRDGDNKVSSSTTKGSSGKLNKLKKILSGKSFSAKFEGVHYRVVSIVELDPPLPVPKRLPSDAAAAAVSLWVRRGRRPLQPIKIHSPSQSQSQSQPSIPCK